jgi:hypothetical protein
MSFPGTLIRPALAVVALVAGTNAAAYWTLYTMDRLETAAGSAVPSLPPALQYEQRDDHEGLGVEVPVDPGVGCTTDEW